MSINKVSFGGKSLQNLVFDGGKSEYFYFKAGANTDWFNVQNWYKDSGFTVPANELPGIDDIAVVLNSDLSSSTSQTVKIGYLIFERNIGRYDYSDQWDNNNPGNFTLSASLKINATVGVIIKNYDVIIQPAWTLGSITNYATITAPSITIDSCNNYGTLNGTVTFSTTGQSGRWEAAGYNYGTINGNANFYGYSVNMGIVNSLTSSSFNETSINGDSGVVNGAVTFNNNSYWSWFSYAANAGTVNGDAVFNNVGNWGNINGSAVFNNTNHESGTITGDVTFNGGWNYSTINNGNVVFNSSAVNYGTINNSTQTTTFNDSSYNGYWGASSNINGGNVIFNSYSSNNGYGYIVNVNNLTFNNFSHNEYWGINASTVTFNNNAYNNAGDYWTYGINSSSIIFNNDSYMYGSVNSTNVTFNDNSYTQSSSYRVTATSVTFNNSSANNCPYVEGTSTFNDNSNNNGGVYDAIFNNYSNNNGTVGNNATFNGASNNYGSVAGTLTCNTTGVCSVPDPSSLLLHLDGPTETNFSDSSPNNLTPTSIGSTIISSSQSKFGGYSAYFDGTTSGIDYGIKPHFAMGGGDFTAEAWIYHQGQNSNWSGSQIMGCHYAGTGASWLLAIESTGEVWAHINGTALMSAYYVPQNTWAHVAMVRYNGTLYLYIDGVSRGTPVSATGDIGIPFNFVIGNDCCGNYRFIGYMDEIRVIKGTAVYTSNFTPPTAPLGAGTSLLLHFDGTDGGANFVDSGPNALTVTSNGGATTSTAQSKFGGSSGYFNGNSSFLSIPHHYTFDFSSNDFTIEAYINIPNITGNINSICGVWDYNPNYSWLFAYIANTGLRLYWSDNGGTGDAATVNWTPIPNQWYHVAVVRSGNTLTFYVDGVMQDIPLPITTANIFKVSTSRLTVGSAGSDGHYFSGYIDDLRVTKGIALYTSNFTPPSMPLGTETSLLLHFDGANGSSSFVDSGPNALTVTANGGATISTTQSKFGGSSGYFSGTPANGSSNLSIPTNTNFGTNDFTIEAWIWIDPATCASGNTDGPCICELGSHSGLASDGFIFMTGYRSGAWILWGWLGPSGGSGGLSYTSSYINPNEWTHVAISRQNNVFRMFINGTKCAEETRSDNLVGSNNSIQVGGSLNGAVANAFGGYIDELRIIKGYAVYTGNFIPEGSPQTLLSMSMTGNNIVDESALSNTLYNNMLTANNNALDFNGIGYFYISSDNTNFNLGTTDFTIETWAYFNTITGADNGQHIIEFRAGGENDAPTLYLYQGILYWYVNGANVITATASISYDTWMHIAVSRANGVTRLYVNGAQAGSDYADSTDYKVQSNRPVFGVNTSGSMAYLNGSLDDIKIIKNQGLYSSSFTPPTRSV